MARRATRAVRRSVRETGFFDATVGLYAIVVGLALFEPLAAFATDVLDHPLDGDWSLRALAVGLVVESVVWFHALTAEMGLAQLASDDAPRHGTLPGVTDLADYRRSLIDFWFGAAVVVLLVVMAAAVTRGPAAFLAVFAVYAATDAVWDAAYLWRHRSDAAKAWPEGRSPRQLWRQLRADRHVPATDEDARALSEEGGEVDLAWARATWYWLAMAALFAVGAALVSNAVALNPALATAASLGWLTAVVVAVAADYLLFPYFYAA